MNREHHGGREQSSLQKIYEFKDVDFTTIGVTTQHESKSSEGKISYIEFLWSRTGSTNHGLWPVLLAPSFGQ